VTPGVCLHASGFMFLLFFSSLRRQTIVSCRFSPFSFQKWTNKKLVLKTKLIQKKDKEISTFPTPKLYFHPTTPYNRL
jgi:hypothetical protein